MKLRDLLNSNDLSNVSKNNSHPCIYKIISPAGRIYIGSTNNFYRRMSSYCTYRSKKQDQHKLFNSFDKYGIEFHKFYIEKICTESEIEELEIHYINKYNSCDNHTGLNISPGGRSLFKHSEESKNKISNSKKGKKPSDETRLRMSKRAKGRISNRKGMVLSVETKNKISESKKKQNKKISEWHKSQISKANSGKKMSKASKIKLRNTLKNYFKSLPKDHRKQFCKPILQYSLNGVFIRETTRTELRLAGFNVDAIKRAAIGKAKTSGGYIWKYKNGKNAN